MTRSAYRLLVGWLAFANATVTALAFLEFQQGLQQPRAVEIRPEGFCDENLRIRNLPEQKIAHAHLAAGTDQQIGVRQAFRVQVPRELLLGDLIGCSPAVAFGKYRVHGIDDLRAPAIIQRHAQDHALVPGSPLHGILSMASRTSFCTPAGSSSMRPRKRMRISFF